MATISGPPADPAGTPARRPCEPWAAELPCGLPESVSEEQFCTALGVATEVLWALSGRQFGYCWAHDARPCPDPCASRCRCVSCTYDPRSTVELAHRPVVQVSEVREAGELVPADAYEVHAHRYLVRTDGGEWPAQDLSRPLGEEGTWSVDYRYGHPVPYAGMLAVGQFALELAKSCVGDSTCQLPRRVTQINRRGVSWTLLDPQDFIDEGRTGIYMVDVWLGTVNPARAMRPAVVARADVRPRCEPSLSEINAANRPWWATPV